jgi:hypothetical protein
LRRARLASDAARLRIWASGMVAPQCGQRSFGASEFMPPSYQQLFVGSITVLCIKHLYRKMFDFPYHVQPE